jgi:Zn-dependent peptidase ImmA (M78 family)
LDKPCRSRFTVCHEVAHVIFHAEQLFRYVIEPARMPRHEPKIFENAEWQADHASGALLMPLVTIVPFVRERLSAGDDQWDLCEHVSKVFKVSMSAAKARIKQISQPDLARLAYHLKQN